MQNITTLAGLKATINDLEYQQSTEWSSIKKDILSGCESLKPANVVKSILKQAIASPTLKTDIADTAIGLTTGFITKKVLIGKTNNPFKKLLGLILEMTVANKIVNNADAIKTVGGILLNKLIPSKTASDSK